MELQDGTISSLPLGSGEAAAEAADLINIYSEPFYHVNADDACQRCSGRCQAQKWGAGFALGESGLALGSQ